MTIFYLFSNVKSENMDNLRWITNVGSRKNIIEQEYIFKFGDSAIAF